MAKEIKTPEQDYNQQYDPNTRTEIERTDTWMNLSRSKKGISIVIKDNFEIGDRLTVPISSLLDLIEGNRSGVNIGIMHFLKD